MLNQSGAEDTNSLPCLSSGLLCTVPCLSSMNILLLIDWFEVWAMNQSAPENCTCTMPCLFDGTPVE